MDFDPKHDPALDLPLRFPDDPVDEPPSAASMRRQTSQEPQQSKSNQKQPLSPAQTPAPALRPEYTVYIRVPAPRNGFVDPPDVEWNKKKDDALWQILSRAAKSDIDWEELARTFDATVEFLLIQATILTERHVSQVRAQTRKVATLGTAGGRESPMPSPALVGTGGGISTSRLTITPTSEAMGRTLLAGVGRVASSEALRRTTSTGSRTGKKIQGDRTPSGGVGGVGVGGPGSRSGSRRPSIEENSQARPTRPSRPSVEAVTSASRGAPSAPVARGHPTYSPATAQYQARRQSPLPIRPARPTDAAAGGSGRRRAYETEGDDDEGDGEGVSAAAATEPESPAALSDSSSSSSSSTPSEPVMSRIFKRPPGHALYAQKKQHRKQRSGAAGYGPVGLGISSGGSEDDDDDDDSETQAAFLRFKPPPQATGPFPSGSGSGSGSAGRHRPHQQQPVRLQHRRSNTGDSSSASSSTSASPTAKVFKAQSIAAAAAASAVAGGGSTSASAMAAARLQSSRVPGIRSPPHHLQKTLSGRSPAVLAAKAAGISREGSETGTTPSIGSSFSDLDDVSFTQSVLDEALGSNVEDTIVTPNPYNIDPMSSSATRRQR